MDESPAQAEWRRWLDNHAPRFLLFARQKSRSEADAQDLVQEAICEAVRRTGEHELPPVSLVYATIHRRAIDLARSENRRVAREQAVVGPASEPWFDTTVEERERANMIQNAVNTLPEDYREVITLKVWGELTFAQIADALGIPANTAASRYRYGLEELRKLTRKVLT
jgi:RNA polymerase sigma-70 factor (ECF subfamily)